jgi:hypothetical protein
VEASGRLGRKARLRSFVLRLASKYEDVQIFGTHAFALTVFVLDRTPRAGGKTVTIPGKCISFLRKQSDGWKYALIIFSYDQPVLKAFDFPIRAALIDGHPGALPVAASDDLSPSFFPRNRAAFVQSCRSLTDRQLEAHRQQLPSRGRAYPQNGGRAQACLQAAIRFRDCGSTDLAPRSNRYK